MTGESTENELRKILDARDEEELEESLQKTQELRQIRFDKKIHFYAPSFMYYKTRYYCSSAMDFPTISVTGKGCGLKCKHCGGRVLETMYPAETPEKLFELCAQLKRNGALGCLISGGCLPDGTVPLAGFVEAIGKVKRELGLTVFVHT
ncbi:radical SAM protein, partial [Candidatus Bathyarchaeota archaeon CG07_land_8_20_14_0_80_47_9]